MEMEVYRKAKFIRENINHLEVKKMQLEKMKKREGDEDFNLCLELAFDGIAYSINRLEDDFKRL